MNDIMFESDGPILLGGIGLAGAYGRDTIAAVLKSVHEIKGRGLEQMEG